MQERDPTALEPEKQPAEVPAHAYQWLLDEHILRDEGAFYGLVGSETKAKEDAIVQFFEAPLAALNKSIELDEQALIQRQATVDHLEDQLAIEQNQRDQLLEFAEMQIHHFFRFLLGLVAFSAVIIFHFFLVYEYLKEDVENPLLVALGVYCFGIFSLLRKISTVYYPDRQPTQEVIPEHQNWKIYLEEYGIPFLTSLFIVFYGYNGRADLSILLFLLLFALFVYAGKGFFQTWLYVQQERRTMSANRQQRKKQKLRLQEAETKITRIRSEIKDLSEGISTLQQTIRDNKVQHARVEAQKAATVSYFLSEYELARSTSRLGIYP